MSSRGIKRLLYSARKKVSSEISDLASHGFYAGGLASEGYLGGYRDALDDVLSALNGIKPQRSGFWEVTGWN